MRHQVSVFNILALLIFFGIFSTVHARIPDKGYSRTAEAFSRVACGDEELFEYNKGLIRVLSYTNKRAMRAFSQLEDVTAEELVAILKKLITTKIGFDNLLLFERFVTLKGADTELSWQFLNKLETLGYSHRRVMTAFELVDVVSAPELMVYIDRIGNMSEPGGWALKAFLELPGQSNKTVKRGVSILESMNTQQQWATEECCKIKGINAYEALAIMALLPTLSQTDAWNARGLFKQEITPEKALSWVAYYFSESQAEKERLFFAESPSGKAMVLKSLAEASDYLTWKINDLHSVTDLRGRELSSGSLHASSVATLETIWNRLDWKVREKFKASFYEALNSGQKGAAIGVLRKATRKARVQVAYDITTVNVYILLSKGSELYDSSFRDILVPVLMDRIAKRFQANLLRFLLDVDPENNHVSDFIISLAQRGKLAMFFPVDPQEQKLVLDLVIQSAFQDENSLILFSATFMTLLETIDPETRTYLIGEMLSAIHEQNTVFTTQLRVILQYYLEYYSEFVGEVDTIRIRMMMHDYGSIPLQHYTKTAFKEWKSDGRLSSLSVFHDDDDGRQSYLSNCRFLSAQGYRPRLSPSYKLGVSAPVFSEAVHLVKEYLQAPGRTLSAMFRLQSRNPLVLDWVKIVNKIEISHSVFLFQGEAIQEKLLKQFLTGGHEMFAQRGHSYWRTEQLMDPISKLVEDGEISSTDLMSKQRFMSLGSCGGIRAYSDLATLFNNNVDILATVGTGKAVINNPYNEFLFKTVAMENGYLSWDDLAKRSSKIFKQGLGEDYLQPGSLPAILHKIMDQKTIDHGIN
ncbi:MAG: hypothetical protein JKY62_01200 [Desulfocapsa sp.]|nr:hypothetical protein [Desulfocapsa sp.]